MRQAVVFWGWMAFCLTALTLASAYTAWYIGPLMDSLSGESAGPIPLDAVLFTAHIVVFVGLGYLAADFCERRKQMSA